MATTPPKWMLIRHELYQSLVSGEVAGQEEVSAEVPAETAEKVPAETVEKVGAETAEKVGAEKVGAEEEVLAETAKNRPKTSRTLRALQMMLANNESIAWPSDDVRLYGQSMGQSAAKVLSALNRSPMRVDVAQKIVLLILSKTAWKRSDYLAGGLGNVWKKIVKFRRENRGSVARANRQNAVDKRKRSQLRSAP